MPFAEDPYVFMEDSDTVAEFNGETVPVWLDARDEDVLQGRAQSTNFSVRMVARDFPTLKYGDALAITSEPLGLAGASFQVQTTNSLEDGVFKEVVLYRL